MSRKNTLLVVDSEPTTRKIVSLALDPGRFRVEECLTGREALRLAQSLKPDVVLVDLNLPDMQGGELISSFRSWMQAPIIVLSALSNDRDIITALDLGADDYVTKPFSIGVLEARINANLRQSATREVGEPELVNGPLRVDLVRHQVSLDGRPVLFTPKEYDLLRYLAVHRGKVLTHREILKKVWGTAHGDNTQYLRVFISQIREKIKSSSRPVLITTAPGIGYRMEVMDPDDPSVRRGLRLVTDSRHHQFSLPFDKPCRSDLPPPVLLDNLRPYALKALG